MSQKAKRPALLKTCSFLLLFLILAACFFYLPYGVVRQNTLDSLERQQSLLAQQAAHSIEEFFKSHESFLRYLAHHKEIIHFDNAGRALLQNLFQDYDGGVGEVSRISADGLVLDTVPFRASAIGQDISSQDFYRKLIESHEPVVSSVFAMSPGDEAVFYAMPVFDQGNYAGCVTLLIHVAEVAAKYLGNITLSENGSVRMISREGIELFCPLPGHVGRSVFETTSSYPTVTKMAEEMVAGKEGATTYHCDRSKQGHGKMVVKHAAYHPVQLPHNLWSIVVATPEKEALAAVLGFGKWWVTLFVVSVIVLLAFSSFFFRVWLKIEEQRKREETEKKLAESQKLFAKFISAAHVPIAMVNVNGTIEFLNEKCIEIYGYTLADIPTVEAWFAKAYPDKEMVQVAAERWQNHLANSETDTFTVPMEERVVVCKDGSSKDVEFAYTLIDDRVIITLNDKTEQNKIERDKRALAQKKAKAKKMEALGLLVGGVAHDLNNLLSGVVSYPELLLLQLPDESPMRSSLELIRQSGKQAAAVVADLLTVARGVASVKITENLNSLVTEYLGSPECQALAARHPDVSCRSELAPDLANISCSAVHVKKCLMNLILNGTEAIEGEGQVDVSTRNESLGAAQAEKIGVGQGAYAVLTVRDTGGGIAEEDIEHIFDPFYTKKAMGRSGTGLGLSVVWSTMQDHGGTVAVTSNDQGTTFELYFPACREEVVDQKDEIELQKLLGHGEKVMVVDDLASQRDIACKFLNHLNYDCYSVSSGEEALEYLAENDVDLVILDMIMGAGMDGCQTYAAMIRRNPDQKAIIASGFSEDDSVKKAQRLGAGDFIKKPYSMRRLGLAVQKALAVEIKPHRENEA